MDDVVKKFDVSFLFVIFVICGSFENCCVGVVCGMFENLLYVCVVCIGVVCIMVEDCLSVGVVCIGVVVGVVCIGVVVGVDFKFFGVGIFAYLVLKL